MDQYGLLSERVGYFIIFTLSRYASGILIEKQILDLDPPMFMTKDWFMLPSRWEGVW